MKESIIWPGGDTSKPVRIVDGEGGEVLAIAVGDTYEGHPVFRLKGDFTIAGLFRITHLLGEAMVEGDLSAQTAARWARDEDLGEIVTDEANDDR